VHEISLCRRPIENLLTQFIFTKDLRTDLRSAHHCSLGLTASFLTFRFEARRRCCVYRANRMRPARDSRRAPTFLTATIARKGQSARVLINIGQGGNHLSAIDKHRTGQLRPSTALVCADGRHRPRISTATAMDSLITIACYH